MCDVCFEDVCCHGREEKRWRRRGKKGEGRGREGAGWMLKGRNGVGRFLEEEGGVRILFFFFCTAVEFDVGECE